MQFTMLECPNANHIRCDNKHCRNVVNARAASSTILPALAGVRNKVGSVTLTSCRQVSALGGPQKRQSQRLNRARTTSPVSWLMKKWRIAQGFGQKSRLSIWCFSTRSACTSSDGREKRGVKLALIVF
jgi:hypothetical protein